MPEFVEDYNKRFGRTPANAKDLHSPLTEADDLDESGPGSRASPSGSRASAI